MSIRPWRMLLPLLVLLAAPRARGHCDGVDGPVVVAAKQALETGDVDLVLIWVLPAHERELRDAFALARKVRALGPEARDLADRAFFETLVRIHRAGEGEPYTGLKPAGRDLGPAIPAADRAVAEGKADELVALLTRDVARGLQERFSRILETRRFEPADVDAGRRYVQAYVSFLHYAEEIHAVATAPTAHGHAAAEHGAHAHAPSEPAVPAHAH